MSAAQITSDLLSNLGGEAPSVSSLEEVSPAGYEKRRRLSSPLDMEVDEGDRASGRKYTTKVGIGILGVLITMALAMLGAKLMAKFCSFCKRKVGDSDEIDDSRTTAWHKPSFAGKVGSSSNPSTIP